MSRRRKAVRPRKIRLLPRASRTRSRLDSAESGNASGSSGTGTTAGNPSDNENSAPAADKPTAPVLELYAGRPDVNQRFEVSNMLPGDTETRYFCVRAYHEEDITLFFRAEVTEQTKNLGDVLHIKVTHLDTGKVLCDAAFNEIDGEEFSEPAESRCAGRNHRLLSD